MNLRSRGCRLNFRHVARRCDCGWLTISGRRGSRRGVRGGESDGDTCFAKADLVTVDYGGALYDLLPVDEGTIRTLQIFDPTSLVIIADAEVDSRDRRVSGDGVVGIPRTADRQRLIQPEPKLLTGSWTALISNVIDMGRN